MTLTVIIMDPTNKIHLEEPVTRRSVRIELTADQEKSLALRNKMEEISLCFIEPEAKGGA
jgi:Flp pilus assembly protein CpaB